MAKKNNGDRLPLPIPYGWFAVAFSGELGERGVKPLEYFDEHLALYRGEDGIPRVLDAYCEHMGAHVGYGEVKGNNLACPFHAWEYDGDGKVVNIPYAKRIPPKVAKPCMKVWPCIEKNKMIWVWYHPQDANPMWEVEDYAECNDESWSDYDIYEWVINSHIQEMAENSVDVAHFKYVHKTSQFPDGQTTTFEGPRRHSKIEAKMMTPKGEIDGGIENANNGPGQSWTRFTGITETFLLSASTPISHDKAHLRFAFTQPKANAEGFQAGVAKAIIKDIVKQVNEDIPIWETKRYLPQMQLCDGDGPVADLRRWFGQFMLEAA